jgi:autotransporter-associated beta strand protein
MNTPTKPFRLFLRALLCGGAFLFLVFAANAQAGSATWNLNPGSGDWNTAANWTPNTVPNSPSDTATFGSSSNTQISVSANTEINTLSFNPGADPYTITPDPGVTLTISGLGASNNSGMMQNFVSGGDNDERGRISFFNSATAGSDTAYTVRNGTLLTNGVIDFNDTSTAGEATFVVEGGTSLNGYGIINFNESSSAGNAMFTSEPGTDGDLHGYIVFSSTAKAGSATFLLQAGEALGNSFRSALAFTSDSSAENATITAEGATTSGVTGQAAVFLGDRTTADNATLIALPGSNGGNGGQITFSGHASGGTARVEVFGNGTMDASGKSTPALTIGSLEGNGIVTVGRTILSLGSNNLSTVFSGVIQEGNVGAGGGITKIGTGTFTLRGASSYTGLTTISAGTLVIANRSGSATGTGAVKVNAGRIGGNGTIAGGLTIGTGAGSGAALFPRLVSKPIIVFTVNGALTFNSDSTYNDSINSLQNTADTVSANGVTINGARLLIRDRRTTTIAPGTVFTLINNTATTAIAGTFSNLADGSTVTIGNNTYQANYEGGDGNDLTLTVVE